MTDYAHHNLHTGQVSIRRQPPRGCTRRVDETADYAVIRNAVPHVSEAGLATLRTKGQRAVVADIRGQVIETGTSDEVLDFAMRHFRKDGLGRRVTFNPWREDTFVYSDTREEFTGCALLVVNGGYCYEVQS